MPKWKGHLNEAVCISIYFNIKMYSKAKNAATNGEKSLNLSKLIGDMQLNGLIIFDFVKKQKVFFLAPFNIYPPFASFILSPKKTGATNEAKKERANTV